MELFPEDNVSLRPRHTVNTHMPAKFADEEAIVAYFGFAWFLAMSETI